jgi:hypothetical protein
MNLKHIVAIFLIQASLGQQYLHLIPHSHDDLGWLETVEGYYDIFVKKVLSSVIEALEEKGSQDEQNQHSQRKFVYSEVGYIKLFLNDDKSSRDLKIEKIKKLIRRNAFEFVNGGMSQADSACTNYQDLSENWFYGMRYLQKNFGVGPVSVWQIDPFGTSQSLLYIAKLFGFEHAVINRINQHLKNKWAKSKELQLIYKLPYDLRIKLHVATTYSSPDGLVCDNSCSYFYFDKTILDRYLKPYRKYFRGSQFHLLGEDFAFSNAENSFTYYDKVLENYDDIKYSLWSEYLLEVETENVYSSEFEGDFFPYIEGKPSRDVWTGYFITKPRLKFKIARLGRILRAIKGFIALNVLFNNKETDSQKQIYADKIVDLAENCGILLHHDTITGTSKRAVDINFFEKILDSENQFDKIMSGYHNSTMFSCDNYDFLTNTTDCNVRFSQDNNLYLHVTNPDLEQADKNFEIVVSTNSSHIRIIDEHENEIKADQICNWNSDKCVVYLTDTFKALQSKQYAIQNNKNASYTNDRDKNNEEFIQGDQNNFTFSDFEIEIKSDCITFRSINGYLFENEIFYESISSEKSGLYILNHLNRTATIYNSIEKIRVIRGNQIEGIYVRGTEIDIKLIKYKGSNSYIVESYIKNSQKIDEGIDVILNIRNKLINNTSFKTDSNGLWEMNRIFEDSQESSIFPYTSFVSIEDISEENGIEIYTDRSQGVTSDQPGFVKIYVQRSCSKSDKKGNNEILRVNEDVIVRHTVYNYQNKNQEYKKSRTHFLKNQSSQPIVYYLFHQLADEHKQYKRNLRTSFNKFVTDIIISYDFIEFNEVLIRVQNVNRFETLKIDLLSLLKNLIEGHTIKEVSFAYFADKKSNEQYDPQDSYQIKPLEYKVFLILK